jgi:hypothetical protein
MRIFSATPNPIIRGSAGVGKTDCVTVLSKCNAEKDFLYLSFGKENTESVKKRFGKNVTSQTFHAFARRYLIKMGMMINKPISQKLKLNDIINAALAGDYHIDNESAFHVISLLEFICNKAVPISYCTEYFKGKNQGVDLNIEKRQLVVDAFKYIWKEAFINPDIPVTHNMYLKLLSFCKEIDTHYDVIIMDEFQDATPIMHLISETFVKDERYRTVRLGDPMQCVFLYQGAIGHKTLMSPDIQLNKSRRCGKSITKVANTLIDKTIGHNGLLPMEPASHADEVTIKSLKTHATETTENAAYLARYNATILKAMISLNKMNIKFSIPNSLSNGYVNKINEIIKLSQNDKKCQLKKLYRNLKDFKKHAGVIDDRETLLLIGIVESYGKNTQSLREDLANIEMNQVSREDARYLLNTIHQSKGSTFNTVVMAADVAEIEGIKEEEVYVIYTAITRARKKLVLPQKLKELV